MRHCHLTLHNGYARFQSPHLKSTQRLGFDVNISPVERKITGRGGLNKSKRMQMVYKKKGLLAAYLDYMQSAVSWKIKRNVCEIKVLFNIEDIITIYIVCDLKKSYY